jgi:hypothetical protein
VRRDSGERRASGCCAKRRRPVRTLTASLLFDRTLQSGCGLDQRHRLAATHCGLAVRPAKKMAGSRPATFRCSSADRALGDLVAVGASPGARAVVLHRGVPAGSGSSRRRNGVADGARERENQSNLGQYGHSPRVEARSGSCGLDRGTQRLFPRSHSNGVRSVQVFVCSMRCAVHHCHLFLLRNEPSDSTGVFGRDRATESIAFIHRVVLWRLMCFAKHGYARMAHLQ